MPNDLASILRVGQQALVSFGVKSTEQMRYLTTVRGWVAGSYIMLDSPAFQNRPISLILGAPCSIRFLADGTACGFNSAVVRASRSEPIFQIGWPTNVEFLIVRKYERIRLFIPCTLHEKVNGVINAELRDLSVGGCRIFSPVSLKPGVDFTLSFESFAGTVLGPLTVVVRNENPSGTGFLVGCQFDALGDVARLELECFVSLKRESMREGSVLTRRVMMIGRDLPLAESLRRPLVEDDVELVVAPGAVDGFHSLRSIPPALILAQWSMPDLDGAGICRVLHATHGLDQLPVIVFGGSAEDETTAQLAGAARFFTNGAMPVDILDAIRELLPRSKTPPKPSVFHWRLGQKASQ